MIAAARASGDLAGPGRFACPSATVPGRTYYVIWVGPDLADCACPGFTYRGTCRHLKAVEQLVRSELTATLERGELAAARNREIGELFDCE